MAHKRVESSLGKSGKGIRLNSGCEILVCPGKGLVRGKIQAWKKNQELG